MLSASEYFREYSVDATKRLYNDRIRVKTRFGYAESLNEEAANSNFIGDVSFEYQINKEGNWWVRLFYFNDQTDLRSLNMHKPTQGGGVALIYQQEFYRRKGLKEYLLDQNNTQINQLYEK